MSATNNSSCRPIPTPHLAWLYGAVLAGGLAGVLAILFLLAKMNTRSATTTAVVNLVVVHGVFLLTVPFRLAYLLQRRWAFGLPLCKFVSAMLHVHMYLTFLFYVVILAIRYLTFFRRQDKVEFYRKLHAVAASAGLWLLVLVIMVPLIASQYGSLEVYDMHDCFHFHRELARTAVRVVNYLIVAAVIAATLVLLVFQVCILASMGRRLRGRSLLSHQEFWAQLKNLFFIGVIMVCFLPYQLFRIYYLYAVARSGDCNDHVAYYNEIFLSVTAVSCFDLLLFVLGGSRWLKQKVAELWDYLWCR